MDKDRTDPGKQYQRSISLASGNNIKAGYIQNITGNEPHKIYLFKDSTILTKYPMANPFKKER